MSLMINTTASKIAMRDYKKSIHCIDELSGRLVDICDVIIAEKDGIKEVGLCTISSENNPVWYRGAGAKIYTMAIYIANMLLSNCCESVQLKVGMTEKSVVCETRDIKVSLVKLNNGI